MSKAISSEGIGQKTLLESSFVRKILFLVTKS